MEKKVNKHNNLLTICCAIMLLSLCFSCGVIWAKLSFTASSTANQSVPPASLSAAVYVGSSASSNTLQSSAFTVANNNSIYLLPTTCGANCVMRARTVNTSFTYASTWTLQDNGWYYYNSIIPPTANSKILFATNSTGASLSGNHIYVELIQVEGVAEDKGFVADWSSLTDEVIVKYNDEANIIQVYSNLTSTFDPNSTGEYFGAYVVNGSNQIYQLGTLSSGSTATLNTTSGTAIYAPVTSSNNTLYTGTLNKAGNGQLSATHNIKLYNNVTSSMVFLVGFSALLYDSSKNLVSSGIANLTLSSTQGSLTSVPNTYAMVVGPGQCESVLSNNSISVTLSEANSSVAYVRLIMSVTAMDVDSFQYAADDALAKPANQRTSTEVRFADAYENALGNSYVSGFVYWLKKLDETNLTYYDLYTNVNSVNEGN